MNNNVIHNLWVSFLSQSPDGSRLGIFGHYIGHKIESVIEVIHGTDTLSAPGFEKQLENIPYTDGVVTEHMIKVLSQYTANETHRYMQQY